MGTLHPWLGEVERSATMEVIRTLVGTPDGPEFGVTDRRVIALYTPTLIGRPVSRSPAKWLIDKNGC